MAARAKQKRAFISSERTIGGVAKPLLHTIIILMTNYEKSNAVTKVDFEISERAQRLARQILLTQGHEERQRSAHFFGNELCYNADIERITIQVTDTKQWHKRRGARLRVKRYGAYYPRTKRISIQNKTAVQAKILAPKSFLDTLLHEWMHHYDYERLKLNSIHTKGFYERIRSLKDRLFA